MFFILSAFGLGLYNVGFSFPQHLNCRLISTLQELGKIVFDLLESVYRIGEES